MLKALFFKIRTDIYTKVYDIICCTFIINLRKYDMI